MHEIDMLELSFTASRALLLLRQFCAKTKFWIISGNQISFLVLDAVRNKLQRLRNSNFEIIAESNSDGSRAGHMLSD